MFVNVLKVLIPTLIIVNLILYTNIFIVKNDKIQEYKNSVLGAATRYDRLQKEFNDYKEKTKNNKQMVIVAKSANSKNVAVGDSINLHTQKVTGDVSIFYKNLTTDETVIVNGDHDYYMASLYKVILTIYILDRVYKGEIALTHTTPGSAITVEKALEKIITESNNEYALALAEKYGWKNIEAYMQQMMGMSFDLDKKLYTDVNTMGKLFEEISLSLKIPRAETTYILELLQDQQRISKLPKYLPQGIYTHNKTGELDDFSHDAGIFFTPKANYILIFMSKTSLPGNTNEQMAKMSFDIYNVLNDIKEDQELKSKN